MWCRQGSFFRIPYVIPSGPGVEELLFRDMAALTSLGRILSMLNGDLKLRSGMGRYQERLVGSMGDACPYLLA